MADAAEEPQGPSLRARAADLGSSSCQTSVLKDYVALLHEKPDLSVPVVAMCALAELLQGVGETTLFGINKELQTATEVLLKAFPHSIPLKAGCELFKTHVRRIADSAEVRPGLRRRRTVAHRHRRLGARAFWVC